MRCFLTVLQPLSRILESIFVLFLSMLYLNEEKREEFSARKSLTDTVFSAPSPTPKRNLLVKTISSTSAPITRRGISWVGGNLHTQPFSFLQKIGGFLVSLHGGRKKEKEWGNQKAREASSKRIGRGVSTTMTHPPFSRARVSRSPRTCNYLPHFLPISAPAKQVSSQLERRDSRTQKMITN